MLPAVRVVEWLLFSFIVMLLKCLLIKAADAVRANHTTPG
jgi:hypothetical protein